MAEKIDPEVMRAIVERLRRTPDVEGPKDVDAAGLVHEFEMGDVSIAMGCRVFEFDVAETIRGGVSAAEIRAAMPALGFRV